MLQEKPENAAQISACCFVHFSSRLQIIPDAALRPDDGLRADLAQPAPQPTTSPQAQSSSDDQMMPDGGRIRIITAQAK